MLQNKNYLIAKTGFDTAEKEPRQVRHKISACEPWFGNVSVQAFECGLEIVDFSRRGR